MVFPAVLNKNFTITSMAFEHVVESHSKILWIWSSDSGSLFILIVNVNDKKMEQKKWWKSISQYGSIIYDSGA
jgi:hypothetical protein